MLYLLKASILHTARILMIIRLYSKYYTTSKINVVKYKKNYHEVMKYRKTFSKLYSSKCSYYYLLMHQHRKCVEYAGERMEKIFLKPQGLFYYPGCIGQWISQHGVRCGWSQWPAKCPWCRQRTLACLAPQVSTSMTPATDHFICSNSSKAREDLSSWFSCETNTHHILITVTTFYTNTVQM